MKKTEIVWFGGSVPTELCAEIASADVAHLPKELVKLVAFLKSQLQVDFGLVFCPRAKPFNLHFNRRLKPMLGT